MNLLLNHSKTSVTFLNMLNNSFRETHLICQLVKMFENVTTINLYILDTATTY